MIVALIVFPVVFLVVLVCVGLGLAFLETRRKTQVRQMLWTAEAGPAPVVELVRSEVLESPLWIHVSGLAPVRNLNRLILQSLTGWSGGKFLLVSVVCGLIGLFLGWKLALFSSSWISGLFSGTIASVMPLFFLSRKRAKALEAFEEQLPDALDFLSRSMRAGHGFSISLEMLVKDASEPMATVLRRVCHEMQMGSSLDIAMEKMLIQFPLVDVRFFVSAVLLQQETGGNLSEILNKLAYVVRERFQLRGKVKALSAHGRITGLVLLLMPIVVVLILLASSPGYLKILTSDKFGRWMLYGAALGQVVGYFVMKKIVNIKV